MDNDMIRRWGVMTQQTFQAASTVAAGSLLPGSLLEIILTAGADHGTVRLHSTATGRADPLFADLNSPYGGGRADAYKAGDSVCTLAPSVGSLVFARCATGVSISRGQGLESAGNGTLQPVTTGSVVAVADEDESTVGEPSPGWLIVRIVAH